MCGRLGTLTVALGLLLLLQKKICPRLENCNCSHRSVGELRPLGWGDERSGRSCAQLSHHSSACKAGDDEARSSSALVGW